MTPYIQSVCDEFREKWNEENWGNKAQIEGFIYSSLESLLRKAMEAVGDEEESKTEGTEDWDNVAGSNRRRSQALASLQALGAKEV